MLGSKGPLGNVVVPRSWVWIHVSARSGRIIAWGNRGVPGDNDNEAGMVESTEYHCKVGGDNKLSL